MKKIIEEDLVFSKEDFDMMKVLITADDSLFKGRFQNLRENMGIIVDVKILYQVDKTDPNYDWVAAMFLLYLRLAYSSMNKGNICFKKVEHARTRFLWEFSKKHYGMISRYIKKISGIVISDEEAILYFFAHEFALPREEYQFRETYDAEVLKYATVISGMPRIERAPESKEFDADMMDLMRALSKRRHVVEC